VRAGRQAPEQDPLPAQDHRRSGVQKKSLKLMKMKNKC
jgi:hypothetical protein